MQIVSNLRKLYYRINWSYVFIGGIFAIWTLYELTDFEYTVQGAFDRVFGYLIMPILTIGCAMVFWDNITKIFKKGALSEGILMYLLWWVWIAVVAAFGVGLALTTWHYYFD